MHIPYLNEQIRPTTFCTNRDPQSQVDKLVLEHLSMEQLKVAFLDGQQASIEGAFRSHTYRFLSMNANLQGIHFASRSTYWMCHGYIMTYLGICSSLCTFIASVASRFCTVAQAAQPSNASCVLEHLARLFLHLASLVFPRGSPGAAGFVPRPSRTSHWLANVSDQVKSCGPTWSRRRPSERRHHLRDARQRLHDRSGANQGREVELRGWKTRQQGHGGRGREEEAVGWAIQRRNRSVDGEIQRQFARRSTDGARGLRR